MKLRIALKVIDKAADDYPYRQSTVCRALRRHAKMEAAWERRHNLRLRDILDRLGAEKRFDLRMTSQLKGLEERFAG